MPDDERCPDRPRTPRYQYSFHKAPVDISARGQISRRTFILLTIGRGTYSWRDQATCLRTRNVAEVRRADDSHTSQSIIRNDTLHPIELDNIGDSGLEIAHEQNHNALPQADGGYQTWLLLAACFVINFLIWGDAIQPIKGDEH